MEAIEELGTYFRESPLAFMRAIPASNLVFDPRAMFMCKFGCKNYGWKHSCPPASSEVAEVVMNGNFKWAILFATTSRIPEGFSRFRIKALNYQKEMEIKRISHQLQDMFNGNGSDHLVLSGGPCKSCRECSFRFEEHCKKPPRKQTSMEAVGIDCQKTMHKAGFDFQMPNNGSINRCGCVLTNDRSLGHLEMSKGPSLQSFSLPSVKESRELCRRLVDEHPRLFESVRLISTSKIEIGRSMCKRSCEHFGNNYSCQPYAGSLDVDLWKYAIVWQWRENSFRKYRYNLALKKIHGSAFGLGHYFSLSLRDCYCDECDVCTFLASERRPCSYRKILSPSMQSQGIDPSSFGSGTYGVELL